MKTASTNKIDMGHGSILAGLIRFAVPLALSNVMHLLFLTADMVVIGRFGKPNALGAVGASGYITNFLLAAIFGLGTAATVMASTCLGARHRERVRLVVHVTMALACIAGIALGLFLWLAVDWLIHISHIPPDVAHNAKTYLLCIAPSMPAIVVYNYGAGLLRAKGDTRRPLYFLVIAGIVNVVLNLVFVIQFHMNVAGIGIATAISHYVSCGLLIACLMRETDEFRFTPYAMRLEHHTASQLLRIGIPTGFQASVFSISNFIVSASVNGFGATVMNGNAAATRIEGYVYVCMNCFAVAAMSFAGFNTGAGNWKRVSRTLFTACGLALGTGLLLGGLGNHFGTTLLGIFTTDPESIGHGLSRLHLVCKFYCLCGIMDCLAYGIRGMGYSTLPAIVSMIGACGLRVLWISTVFSVPAYHTLFWLYMAYPVSWAVTDLAHAVCFARVFRSLSKAPVSRRSSPRSN